ncbi:SDR family NAD(P)-dependent oxidoreductase [Metabacillus arenae]|uniref:SDR family oxidoreductase n=1 Tax=Metabacillus arenae TaxID=2771434 RepID=A0A926RXG9_9BACI|nr:SDR family oxidoreductase [Metabacillus arenae]MBD1380986.1 SDR family oxidoreductase [Metabacillus arenae]
MRLENKVAVISAGASGMGKAGAMLFAKEGAIVNILDINRENGEQAVKEIRNNGGEANFYYTDMSDVTAIKTSVDKIKHEYNRIDILWNHVGIPGPSGLLEVEENDYDFCMDLNIKSGFFTTKYAVPAMEERGGAIIFTTSASGVQGSPFSPVYSAAKGAVVNLVRALAKNLGPKNIRVNSVSPGLTETPMMNQFLKRNEDDDLEENKKIITSKIALGRLASPNDIAYGALFLASEESTYVSGINLPVDGGQTA